MVLQMADRMKKIILFLCSVVLLSSTSYTDLTELYKSGDLKVVPDPHFGIKVPWKEIFFDKVRYRIAISPDGIIFVSDPKKNIIHKFDCAGNLISSFGKKGQGPGDFDGPACDSILDHKYLVVGEYAPNRRISLFDFNGKFVNLFKTSSPTFGAKGLGKGKIAYLTQKTIDPGTKSYEVIVIDSQSSKESEVVSFKTNNISGQGKYLVSLAPTLGDNVFIDRTLKGDLIIGFSGEPEISIYSPEGKKIRNFTINFEKRKIGKEIKEECFEQTEKSGQEMTGFWKKVFQNNYKRSKVYFPEYLACYENLMVDSDGNILIFYHNGCSLVNKFKFQVYAPDGRYICDSAVDIGKLKTEYGGLEDFCFHDSYLYGLVELGESEDFGLKLVKLRLELKQ